MLLPFILLLVLLPFLLGATGDPALDLLMALVNGDGRIIAAALISMVMLGFASVRERIRWLRTDRGGTLSVFVLAYGGALLVALRDDVAITFQLFLRALEVALIAIGGYTGVRRLIWPKDGVQGPPSSPTPLEITPVVTPELPLIAPATSPPADLG